MEICKSSCCISPSASQLAPVFGWFLLCTPCCAAGLSLMFSTLLHHFQGIVSIWGALFSYCYLMATGICSLTSHCYCCNLNPACCQLPEWMQDRVTKLVAIWEPTGARFGSNMELAHLLRMLLKSWISWQHMAGAFLFALRTRLMLNVFCAH